MGSIVAHHRFLTVAAAMILCVGCASKSKQADDDPAAPATAPVVALTDATAAHSGDDLLPPAATGDPASEPAGTETSASDQTVEPETTTAADSESDPTAEEEIEDYCDQQDTAGWLDGSQEWIYETTCRTAAWFDGFFGKGRSDARSGDTHGRLGLSTFWDQRDGFDPSLRFRASFALPSIRDRGAALMVGRGDQQEMVEERTTKLDTIPGNFDRVGDDSFLVGLGVNSKRRTGFKLSIGAKVRAPPEPYIKLRYSKHIALTESTLLGIRPILYVESEDGLGTTLNLELDELLTDNLMLRWANYGNVATGREIEGLEWSSSVFLFQAFSNRRAMTYRVLVIGETAAEETLQNYGFELRYRQRVLRKWLFLELLGGVTWPQYLRIEEREANLGIGVGFEMYFGPVPDREMY